MRSEEEAERFAKLAEDLDPGDVDMQWLPELRALVAAVNGGEANVHDALIAARAEGLEWAQIAVTLAVALDQSRREAEAAQSSSLSP